MLINNILLLFIDNLLLIYGNKGSKVIITLHHQEKIISWRNKKSANEYLVATLFYS